MNEQRHPTPPAPDISATWALPAEPANVPAVLKAQRRWVCWVAIPKPNGKVSKVPRQPRQPGKLASTNTPAHWGTFDEAWAAYRRHGLSGVGFVLSRMDGAPESTVFAVDLDHCIDDLLGGFTPAAQTIIDELDALGCYRETSPSGTGVRILARGTLPGPSVNNHAAGVELYDGVEARYVTVTGRGSGALVEVPEATLSALYERYRPKGTGDANAPRAPRPALPDEAECERLEAEAREALGEETRPYWESGEIAAKYKSPSEQVQACYTALFGRDWNAADVYAAARTNAFVYGSYLAKRQGSETRADDRLWKDICNADGFAAAHVKVASADAFDYLGPASPKPEPAGAALELSDLDLRALSAARFIDAPPPSQVFYGPIPAGTTGVVYGAGGSSKSTLLQALCNALATGVDVLGVSWWVPPSVIRVLMVSAEESTDDLHRRQHAIVQAVESADALEDDFFGEPPARGPLLRARLREGRFTLVSTHGMHIEIANERGRRKGADWLLRQVDRGRFDVVVLDPIASYRSGPEDALQPVIGVGREINAKTGAAVVFVHHSNKVSRGTDQAREATAARGDSALLDGARFGLGVAGMTIEEATKLKVEAEERRHFVGVRLAKANYSAESDVLWFRRGPAGIPYATSFSSAAEQKADSRKAQRAAVLRLVAELEAAELRVSKSDLVRRAHDRSIGTRDALRVLVEDLVNEKALRHEFGEPGDTERRAMPFGWIVTGVVS